MIELTHILITSLAIIGLHKATGEGMILFYIAEWLFKHLPKWLYTPLLGCPPCMASIWGTAGFLLMEPLTPYWALPFQWAAFVLAVCGLNTLIYSTLNWLESDGK